MLKVDIDELIKNNAKGAEMLILSSISNDVYYKHTFSAKFERQMEHIINMQAVIPLAHKFVSKLKKVAIVFLVITIIGVTTTVSVEASRIWFIDKIISFIEDFTSISFYMDKKLTANSFSPVYPNYLPKGYVLEEQKSYDYVFTATYSNTSNEKIIYRQMLINNNQNIFDADEKDIIKTKIKGYDAYIIKNSEYTQLLLQTDYNSYKIVAKISVKEIKKIASSLDI